MIIQEEALALPAHEETDIETASGQLCTGLLVDGAVCAIGIGDAGFPMLEAFRALEPDAATGKATT